MGLNLQAYSQQTNDLLQATTVEAEVHLCTALELCRPSELNRSSMESKVHGRLIRKLLRKDTTGASCPISSLQVSKIKTTNLWP